MFLTPSDYTYEYKLSCPQRNREIFKEFNSDNTVYRLIRPGLKKEDFKITVDKYLNINIKNHEVLKHSLPKEVILEGVTAKYEAGILYITFPLEKHSVLEIDVT